MDAPLTPRGDLGELLEALERAVIEAEATPRTAPLALVASVRQVVRAELDLWRAVVARLDDGGSDRG